MLHLHQDKLKKSTKTLLEVINSTDIELLRQNAITELAQSGEPDTCRLLIDIYERLMWRSTKIAVIKCLGKIRHWRSQDYLVKIAKDHFDLGLVSAAIASLGELDSLFACEFLLSIVTNPDHPRRSDAIAAITNSKWFQWSDELENLLIEETNDPSGILPQLVLAIGRKGTRNDWNYIEKLLPKEFSAENSHFIHAAILSAGAIGGVRVKKWLSDFDSNGNLFVEQLRQNALDQIEIKKNSNLDDIITSIIDIDTSNEISQIYQLRLYSAKAIKTAVEPICTSLPAATVANIELFLNEETTIGTSPNAIANFIARDDLNLEMTTRLIRHVMRVRGENFLTRVYNLLDKADALPLMQSVKAVDATCEFLFKWLKSAENHQEYGIEIINGIVNQISMTNFKPSVVEKYGKSLLNNLHTCASPALRQRILRAIGQIGYKGAACENTLKNLLYSGLDTPSIFHCIGHLKNDEMTQVIIDWISQKLYEYDDNTPLKSDHAIELKHAIRALSRHHSMKNLIGIEMLTDKNFDELHYDLLNVLTKHPLKNGASIVNKFLNSKDFSTKMSAVTAAKFNHNEDTWSTLFNMLNVDNFVLCTRIVDSICIGGSHKEHKKIIRWAISEKCPDGIKLKAFSCLEPKIGNYRDVTLLLQEYIQSSPPAELLNMAENLYDNLIVSLSAQSIETKKTISKELKRIDEVMAQTLTGFQFFSETVKTVLRNAELTFAHSEIFNEDVDKSTVIIEYVKSIDILLQERLGGFMFLKGQENTLVKMQSRLLLLGLDDNQVGPKEVINRLSINRYFGSDDFPYHKLQVLTDALLSGKIQNMQFKTIDGLRSWGLLLLIFGRQFKYKGKMLKPIFPLAIYSHNRVCELCMQLNRLQELRNTAAHRGTLLSHADLESTRKRSLRLLDDCDKILGIAQQFKDFAA